MYHTRLVYPVAELLEGRVGVVQDDGLVVVRYLPLRLRVDADHVAVIPHLLKKLHGHRNANGTQTEIWRDCQG